MASLPLDSQNEIYLSTEDSLYGTCIDEKSLKLVNVIDFLNTSNNHIIVINNGFKYGDRRSSFEALLHGILNLYKGEDDNFYVLSKYNKMINIQDYLNYFNTSKYFFKITSDGTLKNFKCMRTYEKCSYVKINMISYSIEEYNNSMI